MKFTNIKDGLTDNQIERQKVRENGKYSNYPKCELCGKKVPPHKYYSDERCNIGGVGLVLCKKCCVKSDEMHNKEFFETFADVYMRERKDECLSKYDKYFPDRI